MNTITNILLTSISSTALTGLCIFIFKNWFTQKLIESSSINIERIKAELNNEQERLKHDLYREALKIEKSTVKIYEIYPELLSNIINTNDLTQSIWGFKFMDDFTKYSEEELEKLLEKNNISDLTKNDLRNLYKNDKGQLQNKLGSIFTQKDLWKAREALDSTSKQISITTLYQSKEINIQLKKIKKMLNETWVAAYSFETVSSSAEKYLKSNNEISAEIESLESLMKKELISSNKL